MEPITQCEIDLFVDELPSIEQITKLSESARSSEINRIAFSELLEENISKTGPKAVLPVGIALFIVGRNQEAAEKLKKAKDCKEKFLFMALALRRLSRFDEAIQSLQKSLDFDADPFLVTLRKTAIYRSASDFDAAANELKGCSNFKNVSAEYHYQLARLEEAQGLYEQAIGNYKIALELSPNYQKALFHLAYRCDLAGDEQAAIDYYKQISVGSVVYVNALLNLAVLYEDVSEFDKAAQCIDTVLKYHPNHQRAILFKKDVDSSKTMFYDEEKEKKRDRRVQILETPITDFELSVRSRNCFRKMGIKTLGDLLNISETELLAYKNFGETSLKEIKIILDSKGLQLWLSVDLPSQEGDIVDEVERDEDRKLMSTSIEELNLSVRAQKCLQKLDIRTFGDLVSRTEAELLGCKNFGVTSLNEIKKAMNKAGLSLRKLD